MALDRSVCPANWMRLQYFYCVRITDSCYYPKSLGLVQHPSMELESQVKVLMCEY
uniref:Uncharacterized protein n=1 Tax=Anguilla anguilla TaxID=7936 RepID=A0A0E9SV80_ANGAN